MVGTITTADGRVHYEWHLGRKSYEIERARKPVSELLFDPRNQRVQYALRAAGIKDPAKVPNKEIGDVLRSYEASYLRDLQQQVEDAGGLNEPLVVAADGTVIEGNCRLAILQRLSVTDIDNEEFSNPWCELLPGNFDEEARMMFLGECHIAGKQSWDPYEKADFVWRMNHELGKTHEELARMLRMTKSGVGQLIAAFEMHKEFLDVYQDGKYVHRWSYFLEFQKRKELKSKIAGGKDDPAAQAFKERFFRWVADDTEGFFTGTDVRKLVTLKLIDDEDALTALDTGGIKAAEVVHLQKVNSGAIPSDNSTFPHAERALHEFESLTLKELDALRRNPGAPAVAKVRDLYQRIVAFAEMANIALN